MKDNGLEGYLETYLAKAREHGFTPSDARGIVRYLLTNGLIDITNQHLILMGNTGFHLGADRIPKEYRRRADLESVNIHEKFIKAAKEVEQKYWSAGDFNIVEHVKDISTELEIPHPKGWTHLCKGDCGGYHAPYGKDYSNAPPLGKQNVSEDI